MIDLVFGAVLVALIVRGWMRGLLRQAIELGVLIGGVFLGFRLSRQAGSVVESMAGTSPTASRIIGGAVVFLLISFGAALMSRVMHWGVRMLPGLTTLNRVGGAAAAAVAWVFVAAVVISLAAVLPMPDGTTRLLDESAVARAVTTPNGPTQRAISVIGGDRVVASALALEDILGTQRVAAGSPLVALPPTEATDLDADYTSAGRLFDDLNRERVDRDLDPLAWSDALQAEALKRAVGAYSTGRLTRTTASGVEESLGAAGLPVFVAWESMVMAPSPEATHETMLGTDDELEAIIDSRYRRLGVGVVDGPYGMLTVYVFAG